MRSFGRRSTRRGNFEELEEKKDADKKETTAAKNELERLRKQITLRTGESRAGVDSELMLLLVAEV